MYSKNVWKIPEEESKKRTCIFTLKLTLGQFLFCLCKSTTWFLRKRKIDSKWVIPNNQWINKISELLQTTPSTILNFLLTIKVVKNIKVAKVILIFHVCEKSAIYHDMKGDFIPHQQVFHFFFFFQCSSY